MSPQYSSAAIVMTASHRNLMDIITTDGSLLSRDERGQSMRQGVRALRSPDQLDDCLAVALLCLPRRAMFLSWHGDLNRYGNLHTRTFMVVNDTTSKVEPENHCTQQGD